MSALEFTVNYLLHTNTPVIQNIVDAIHCRYTSSLFPVKDLTKVLESVKEEHQITALFGLNSIHHYYPLLESFMTSDAMVIHVPFRSWKEFEVFRIEPFPFSVNSSVMMLNLPSSVVLVNRDYILHATGLISELDTCRTEHLNQYICSASHFAFLPVTGGDCEVMLTQSDASKGVEVCPCHYLVPRPLFHRRSSGFHYFFFTQLHVVSVVCPEGITYKKVTGHLAIHIACFLCSSNFICPEKLHEGFTSSMDIPVFPLGILLTFNISTVKVSD